MEDTYYFSQGRLISITPVTPVTPYNKFKDEDKNNEIKNSLLYKIINFQIYKKSILRYKL